MEIEIATTKKKISASLIKQFKRIAYYEIEGAECLGYVIKILKDTYKTYIIRLANGEYRMLEYGWYHNQNTLTLRKSKGILQFSLETEKDALTFIAFLNECSKSSQIFI